MSHIFISYSRKNQPYARMLADELLRRGFDVWIDDRIDYGDDWEVAIFDAIEQCGAFLPIMTPDAWQSKWVRRECQHAEDEQKAPFPLLLEGKTFPRYNLTQHVDVRTGELPPNDYFARLAKVVKPKATGGVEVGAPEVQTPPPAPPRIQGGETTHALKVDTRQFPIIIKPDWVGKVIPEPFEWCVVPAGKVTLEPGGYLKEVTTFDVPEFQIASYPITNAQFEVFVKAKDGWRNREWWNYSASAKAWRATNERTEAARFRDCADCPREFVTWYAAVAFTCWLSAKTGERITLPTEQQWQRAAQGDDGREYPWGNKWDARKCNSNPSGIGKTTPVTRYPQGMSPFGVLDMSGNVWEWCLTDYTEGSDDISTNTKYRVLHGGPWSDFPQDARAARRSYFDPDGRFDDRGFRVVMGAPPT